MRWVLTGIVIVIALWCAAFAVFLGTMYMPAAPANERADVLIVLTGGNARVERGFELLGQGAAPVLFISGVGQNVTLTEMLAAHTTPDIRQAILKRDGEIVFDYDASTTQTNASEAASFIRERGYHSIRLITGHYHMPRSMVEFHAALPGVTILREPVIPDTFQHEPWWNSNTGRKLIWQEFHKYLAASGRTLLQRA